MKRTDLLKVVCRKHREMEEFCPACWLTNELLNLFPERFDPDTQYTHVLMIVGNEDAHDLAEVIRKLLFTGMTPGYGLLTLSAYATDRIEIYLDETVEYHDYKIYIPLSVVAMWNRNVYD
jgi:hypothetical protein